GPEVPRAAFRSSWSDRPVLLVGLGDSITAGFGAAPPALSYFNRLVKNPPDEFPEMRGLCLSAVLPRLEALNLARSGSNSIENLEILLPKLPVQSPDVFGIVVMTTGGNDIIHYYGRTPPREGAMYGATFEQAKPWIANFRGRLLQTIAEIKKRFPGGCALFIGNIYDPTDGVGDPSHAGLPDWPDGLRILDAYNRIIADCAEADPDVHLVDIRSTFLGHGIHCRQFWRPFYRPDDPHYWFASNLEDPNNRGYDVIRRLFLIEMASVLPARLAKTD
ncbi:MAG: SGNH/GDSL hydrolase family protein, partial [Planctomycetes bacterium]|nr:SGNH/GDSL hydrolase family protein [Planctomycetota bacterium]